MTFTLYVSEIPNPLKGYWQPTLEQIRVFHQMVRNSRGQVRVVRNGAHARKVAEIGSIGAVLAIEGGHSLGGRIDRIPALASMGVRMLTVTHFAPNGLADSAEFPIALHRGLSKTGRKAIRQLHDNRILPDVAHMSDDAIRQTIDESTGPIVDSHTGMRAINDRPRNLSDELARGIAGTGGLIGVIFFPPYLKAKSLRVPMGALIDHIVHAAYIVGPEHVGIGTDLDAFTWVPDGMAGHQDFPRLSDALARKGFSANEIAGMLGGNYLDLLDRFDATHHSSTSDIP